MKKFVISFLVCTTCLLMSVIVVSAAKSGYFTYTTSGGKAVITDVDTNITGAVAVPSSLGGCSVTVIADDAFFLCKAITEIAIPNTVTTIGDSAFYSCSSLVKVDIPESVKIIGESAFSECKKLKEINIAESNEYITFEDGILYCGTTAIFGADACFAENTVVRIKENTTKIGAYAFAKCENITNLEMPESVTYIGNYAFEVCKNIKEIKVKGTITGIGEYAFMENFALESFYYGGVKEPSIAEGVFESCTELKVITVSPKYEGDIFSGYSINKTGATNVTINENCSEIVVENINEKAILILASYKGNALIDCVVTEIVNGGNYKLSSMKGFVYDELNADVVKAFVWEDMIDFRPVCANEEYSYKH